MDHSRAFLLLSTFEKFNSLHFSTLFCTALYHQTIHDLRLGYIASTALFHSALCYDTPYWFILYLAMSNRDRSRKKADRRKISEMEWFGEVLSCYSFFVLYALTTNRPTKREC